MSSSVLLGYTYSLDRIARVAAEAGVQLVLPLKAKEVADSLGLPTMALPSFKNDPDTAALQLNAMIKERKELNIGAFWPLSASAFDVSGVTACPVHTVTTPELFALVNDKKDFADMLGDDPIRPKGVETVGAEATIAEVKRRLKKKQTAFVKPPRGVNGSHCWEIRRNANLLTDPDARVMSLKSYRTALREREAEHGPERWLVMERLNGPELSVDALCVKGELLKWMVREKVATARQIVRSEHVVVDHVRRIIKELGLHGLVSIQYMFDADGNVKILEINLRPSGGCVAYGETALAARGATGLLTDWLKYLAGMITPDEITQWSGDDVKIHIRATAFVE